MELPLRFEQVLAACQQLPVGRFAQLCGLACRRLATGDVSAVAGPADEPAPSDPAEKEAAAVLMAALAESHSRRVPLPALLAALEERGLSGEHLAAFADACAATDAEVSARLLQLAPGRLPHVVGVEWRLDWQLRGSDGGRPAPAAAAAAYRLALLTESPEPGGATGLDAVRVHCTAHQLQDLLAQLREALRAVEAASVAAGDELGGRR